MTVHGFEFGTHAGSDAPVSYGLKIQRSEPPPQRYEPDEEHPCGAVGLEYSNGTTLRCILEAGHLGWHASKPAQPPYEKYPQIQWAPR